MTATVYDPLASAKIIVNGVEATDGKANLNAGNNSIKIVVTAQNGMTNTYEVRVDRAYSGSSSSGTAPNQEKPNPQPQNEVRLIINGRSYDQVLKGSLSEDNALVVTIDAPRIQKIIEDTETISTVRISVTSKAGLISVVLPGNIVKMLEGKKATWEILTPGGNYSLPAAEIGIDRLAARYGTEALKDTLVRVSIGETNFTGENGNSNGAGISQLAVVGQPVDFQIIAEYKGKKETVSKFSKFIKREIPLPDGIKPNDITTAIVIHEDGTFHPVPTYVRLKDGNYYAIIHSTTNSVYALVKRQVNFADVDKHWSKAAVNDLASRFIVNGVDQTRYDPNAAVTRAEFAAIIVRALGLSGTGGPAGYKDVQSDDWYASAVSKAQKYGLINGYEDGTFRPSSTITREEAIALVIRAMKLAGMETEVSSTEIETSLSQFPDSGAISNWAKAAIISAVKNGIVNGTETGLKPNSSITRAETASIVQRVLKKAKLID